MSQCRRHGPLVLDARHRARWLGDKNVLDYVHSIRRTPPESILDIRRITQITMYANYTGVAIFDRCLFHVHNQDNTWVFRCGSEDIPSILVLRFYNTSSFVKQVGSSSATLYQGVQHPGTLVMCLIDHLQQNYSNLMLYF